MSNRDFSMMGRPRPEALPPQNSNGKLYALFGGGMIVAALVGALVSFLVTKEMGPGVAPRTAARPAAKQQAQQQARGGVAGPQWATTGTYGAGWLVRCQIKDGKPGKPCVALLQVVNQQSKRTLLAWIIGTDD